MKILRIQTLGLTKMSVDSKRSVNPICTRILKKLTQTGGREGVDSALLITWLPCKQTVQIIQVSSFSILKNLTLKKENVAMAAS